MQPDGSNSTRLTNNLSLDGEPNWSPDGTRMVFVTQRDIPSLWEIYVMEADGSNPTRLTNNSALDINPKWSPDGTLIAFTSDRPDGFSDFEVYVMGTDGSNPIPLTNTPQGGSDDPSWQSTSAPLSSAATETSTTLTPSSTPIPQDDPLLPATGSPITGDVLLLAVSVLATGAIALRTARRPQSRPFD